MLKKATTNPNLTPGIQRALAQDPDYSPAFTAQVKKLACAIEAAVPCAAEHDSDMNYNAGQKIEIWMDKQGRPLAPHDPNAAYRLAIFVSSKGRYFAFVTLALSQLPSTSRKRSPVWENAGPKSAKATEHARSKIAAVLAAKQFALLEGEILAAEVEDHVTEMDGTSATVFEVLFAEVV